MLSKIAIVTGIQVVYLTPFAILFYSQGFNPITVLFGGGR